MLATLRESLRPGTVILLWIMVATAVQYGFGGDGTLALHLYLVPVLMAGYSYGRMRALGTAAIVVAIVVGLEVTLPDFMIPALALPEGRWFAISSWALLLTLAAGLTGHLYESKQRALDDVRHAYNGVLEILSMFIDTADRYTEAHSGRVAIYSTEIAKRMGIEGTELEDLRVAALLHDIGKADVSGELLRKVGELTSDEWDVIKRHPANGAWMLGRVGGVLRNAVPLVLYHHEHWNGSGYYGLRREEIPLGARIIAVADAFDAMTTNRSYRDAMAVERALTLLQEGAGEHFDPDVVAVFLDEMQDPHSELRSVRFRPGSHEQLPEAARRLSVVGG